MTDVEMAQDEVGIELRPISHASPAMPGHQLTTRIQVFAGPMSESIPTSISSFAHRRARADSTTSFTYYDDDRDSEEGIEEEAIAEEYGDIDEYDQYAEQLDDLEAGVAPLAPRRKSSGYSRRSVDAPLLRRHSASSAGSYHGWSGGRLSQKLYILTEDLTIVVAGFKTSSIGFIAYTILCVVTAGLA